MARNQNTWESLDKWTLFYVFALAVFGWFNIYGASYMPEASGTFHMSEMFDFSNNAGKQFVWMCGAIILGTIILIIDRKAYEYFAYVLYAIAILVLIVTAVIAPDVKGSKSFLEIGPLRIQPAEFSKFIIALTLAKYMGREEYSLKSWRDLIVPAIIILIPLFIIMVPQKETGSALVLVSFLIMLYREGMSGFVFGAGIIAVALFLIVIRLGIIPLPLGIGDWGILGAMCLILLVEVVIILIHERRPKEALILSGGIIVYFGICLVVNIWLPVNFNILSTVAVIISTIYLAVIAYRYKMSHTAVLIAFSLSMLVFSYICNYAFENILQDHQRARIEQLLGIIDDPTGVGYNTEQAKVAIATGRLTGKGFHEGTQTKMKFVPEQHTDFIFCTVGEEHGFIGTTGVIVLYTFLLIHLIKMAERQRNRFSRMYGYCVVGILFFHVAINIGMVIGLLPVIGIPLPFFSYGGSSLWGFTILLFIFLKLDTDRVNEL